jgi:membrane-bound serine protease (ClpP class)
MNDITQSIRESRVPVVVYVAPRGGLAASAGAVITMAGHAAAMSPQTRIGAASPVGGQGENLGDTLKSKLIEDMKATVRTLTAHRPPAAIRLAENMVEKATAVTEIEALEVGLIDFIAQDLEHLLDQLDGFSEMINGSPQTLRTQGAQVNPLGLLFIERLLLILTNPNIVFLLITIGVQALLIELSSPGGWVAGFIGVVSLALAIYGLGVLPVNWFGLVFVILAFGLFVLDVKAPTHGGLTLAGIGSLVVGALVLFNSPGTPQFLQVSIPLVILVSLLTAAIFFTALTFVLRAQKRPVQTGAESLILRQGIARSAINPRGNVQMGGELWTAQLAEGQDPIAAGDRVEMVRTEGVRLLVRKAR